MKFEAAALAAAPAIVGDERALLAVALTHRAADRGRDVA
jgi:hypothetical protein